MISESVYSRAEFQSIDIGEMMRYGHPYIREGDEYIVEIIKEYCKHRKPVLVLDIGSGSAVLSKAIAESATEAQVIANEIEPNLVRLARTRCSETHFDIFDRPFEDWNRPVDIIISWGSHHHLPNDYLVHVKKVLRRDGIFIFGDEFCPEYCTPYDEERIAKAEIIWMADGFLLTTEKDRVAFKKDGIIPQASIDLERQRQQALWKWYKHVIDYAMEKECLDVAISELQIARDDMITGFRAEHKLSPLIVERDLQLRGFKRLSKRKFGPADSQFQSFFVYEYASIDAEHHG